MRARARVRINLKVKQHTNPGRAVSRSVSVCGSKIQFVQSFAVQWLNCTILGHSAICRGEWRLEARNQTELDKQHASRACNPIKPRWFLSQRSPQNLDRFGLHLDEIQRNIHNNQNSISMDQFWESILRCLKDPYIRDNVPVPKRILHPQNST